MGALGGHRAEVVQAASRSQVTAVVLSVPAVSASSWGSWGLNGLMQARWTAPDGAVVTGELPLTIGTTAGEKVRVWTTRSGQGRATQADVTQAVDTVTEHLDEQETPPASASRRPPLTEHVSIRAAGPVGSAT